MSFLNPIRRRGQYSVWHAVAALICALILLDFGACFIQGTGTGLLMHLLEAAQLYVRPVAGVNSNDGLDWVNAKQTITSATTSLANGDWVYCEESSAPTSVGNATWTAGDRSVVLQTACAALIYACDGTTGYAWRPETNVTTSGSTTMKEGTHSASIVVGASFTTGVVATANRNADLNCSGYQQISFWVRVSGGVLLANRLALAMYSDDYPTSALTNLVGKAYLPGVVINTLWIPVTVDYGGALGTVRTVALLAEVDPGSLTVLIDDILACKAPTEPDSLTLTSLISKGTANEPWFAIGSINGTAVELESMNAIPSSTIGSYGGTTGLAATYKCETWKTTPVAATTTAVQTISDSGIAGAPITIAGGYANGADVTVAPTGLTIFDGGNGYGYGLYNNAKSYVTCTRLGFARYQSGVTITGAAAGLVLTDIIIPAAANVGLLDSATGITRTYSGILISGGVSYGVYLYTGAALGTKVLSDCYAHGCGGSTFHLFSLLGWDLIRCQSLANSAGTDFYIWTTYDRLRLYDCVANGCSLGTRALYTTINYWPIYLYNFTSSNHTTESVCFGVATSGLEFRDSSLGEGTEFTWAYAYGGDGATSTNHDDAAGSHFKWEYGATYNSTQATRHTASGWAWQLSPTNVARSGTWPLRLPVGQVYLASGVATTVTAWCRRSNAGLTMSLVCPGGQITGIAADVTDSVAEAADTWELLSIPLTSTEAGVVTIEAQAYTSGVTTYSGYIDDISSDQTGTFTGLDNGTGAGPTWINAASGAAATTRVSGGVW